MLGVMPPEEAVKIAKAEGLDLVEVAANAHHLFAVSLNLVSTSTSLARTRKTRENGKEDKRSKVPTTD